MKKVTIMRKKSVQQKTGVQGKRQKSDEYEAGAKQQKECGGTTS